MKRIENKEISAGRIRRINGTSRTSSILDPVITSDEDEVDVAINEKLLMEEIILKAYEVDLTQANNTPCM